MSKERIETFSKEAIDNGLADGSMPDESDWDRVSAMTDAEVEASIADDPDWQGMDKIDWSKAHVHIPPPKRPVSIRLDGDVVTFFKAQGPGYQTRINAVLRAYMQEIEQPKKRA